MGLLANLIVKLGLESKDYNKGIDDAKKKTDELGEGSKGASDKFAGAMGKITKVFAGVTAAIGAGIVIFKTFKSIMESNQATGDRLAATTAGLSNAFDYLKTSIANMDFSGIIQGMENAYDAGKKAAQMLDEVFERTNSWNISNARARAEIAQLNIDLRNVNLSDEQRLAAGQRILTLTQEQADAEKDIARQTLEANKMVLQSRTGLSDASLKYIVDEYEKNREVINLAQEYNKILEKRDALKGNAGIYSDLLSYQTQDDKDAIAEYDRQLEALRKVVGDVPTILAQYERSNDGIVTAYAESAAKLYDIEAAAIQSTTRAQTTINSLKKEQQDKRLAEAAKAEEAAAAQANRSEREKQKEILKTGEYIEWAKNRIVELGALMASEPTTEQLEKYRTEIADLTKDVEELSAVMASMQRIDASGLTSIDTTLKPSRTPEQSGIAITNEIEAQAMAQSIKQQEEYNKRIDELRQEAARYFSDTEDIEAYAQHWDKLIQTGQQKQAEYEMQYMEFSQDLAMVITSGVSNMVTSFAQGIGELIATGDVSNFGEGLLKAIGSFLSQLGEMLIEFGMTAILFSTLQELLGSGPLAIPAAIALVAAGAALVAIGSAISSTSKAGTSGGGSVSPTGGNYAGAGGAAQTGAIMYTMADVPSGDYTAPGVNGDTQKVWVEGELRLSGGELVAALSQYNRKQGRIG